MVTEWLPLVEAIALIRTAEASGTAILGFDAAWVRPDATQPSVDDSWDYSLHPVADPYGHAVLLMQERAVKGLKFEIVLADG
jgi:hypothetical protein